MVQCDVDGMLTSDMKELAKLAAISQQEDEIVEETSEGAKTPDGNGPGILQLLNRGILLCLFQNCARESNRKRMQKTTKLSTKMRIRRH